ncbi:DUF2059 domain-containing protein [Aliiroseovarius lamellibrachiae]|uniref:DUF2059 domain-containing protein n=1 Tax=Aliiroseovarius lamellibrachiae TaxID=1924933 RepID=UPI001BE1075C|nr:DUF2059 domain-containing protein [Aliiroseovarius lamellibrachiae]MBT2132103.1 DUF2059 domain-containing protein [Aliiroseovarius lamellibrachiae]
MRNFISALAVAATLSTPALAEETYEQRLALATGYIEATLQDINMPAMIETMWQPIVADIRSKDIPLSDAQIAQISKLYQDEMTEPMLTILRDQSVVMAEVFTFDEIKAIRDFYATDLGRAAMTKLPQIAERQTPMVLKMVQEKMPMIIPQIQEILAQGVEAQ